MIDPTKIGRNTEPGPPRQNALSSENAEGKRDEFREAMRQDTEKGDTGDKSGGKRLEDGQRMRDTDEKGEASQPPPFSGDALLRGLGASFAPLETQATAPVSASQETAALATELAERILVNTDNRASGNEVRINLKDSVLPDTEIILRQDGDRLVVQLVSGNPASLEALRMAQEDLQNKLLALDQKDISVEVLDSRASDVSGRGGSGQGDSGQDSRSKGLDYFNENVN